MPRHNKAQKKACKENWEISGSFQLQKMRNGCLSSGSFSNASSFKEQENSSTRTGFRKRSDIDIDTKTAFNHCKQIENDGHKVIVTKDDHIFTCKGSAVRCDCQRHHLKGSAVHCHCQKHHLESFQAKKLKFCGDFVKSGKDHNEIMIKVEDSEIKGVTSEVQVIKKVNRGKVRKEIKSELRLGLKNYVPKKICMEKKRDIIGVRKLHNRYKDNIQLAEENDTTDEVIYDLGPIQAEKDSKVKEQILFDLTPVRIKVEIESEDHVTPGTLNLPKKLNISAKRKKILCRIALKARKNPFGEAAVIVAKVLRTRGPNHKASACPQRLLQHCREVQEMTREKDNFFKREVISSKGQTHLIFAEDRQLELMAQAELWYLDVDPLPLKSYVQLLSFRTFASSTTDTLNASNFRSSPNLWKSLNYSKTLHHPALAFVLMSSRKKRDYAATLRTLREILPRNIKVRECVIGFKKSLCRVLESAFEKPVIRIWEGSWIRRLNSIATSSRFLKAGEFSVCFSLLHTLPFIPAESVPQALHEINKVIHGKESSDLLDNVHSTLVGGKWPPPSWSAFLRPLRLEVDLEEWSKKVTCLRDNPDLKVPLVVNALREEVSVTHLRSMKCVSSNCCLRLQRRLPNDPRAKIQKLWRLYIDGKWTIKELISGCSEIL